MAASDDLKGRLADPLDVERADSVLPSFAFPGAPERVQVFMNSLIHRVEEALEGQLLPSATPAAVRSFQSAQGSKGSIHLFRGKQGAAVDKLLLSWLYCLLPGGAAFGQASLAVFMGPATDTPHLLLEFNFASPADGSGGSPGTPDAEEAGAGGSRLAEQPTDPDTSWQFRRMTGFMDLLPRRDLVMHPEYLDRLYVSTGLDSFRKEVQKNTFFAAYEAPTPYVRATMSPTPLSFSASSAQSEELVEAFQPLAHKAVDVWVQSVMSLGRPCTSEEVAHMAARDLCLFEYGIEEDVGRNLPRIFGQETTLMVMDAIRAK